MRSPKMLFLAALLAYCLSSVGCNTVHLMETDPSEGTPPQIRQGDVAEIVAWGTVNEEEAGNVDNSRIRIFEGPVENFSTSERTVTVGTRGGPATLPFDQITNFRVLRDRKEPNGAGIKKSLLWGGAIAGGCALISTGLSNECTGWFCTSDRDTMIFLGLTIGVPLAVGGTIGGLLGAEETWELINLPPVRPAVLVAPSGRLGLGLSVPVGR